jgi:SNF2 family DNA or RNA helicase
MIDVTCTKCNGTGKMPKMVNVPKEVACPKDDALKELLEENEDTGRIVIYAGFTASVDRVARLCVQNGWEVIRVDGRGQWTSFDYGDPKRCVVCGDVESAAEHNTFHPQFHAYRPHTAIEYFQDRNNTQKIAFVGQPGAAGVSITLTAASMLVYYSNTFNGVDRFQSEDRIHRIGMDVNRGATIVDLLHLPTDIYILDNLQKKKVLQAATMGELQMFLEMQNG